MSMKARVGLLTYDLRKYLSMPRIKVIKDTR